MPKLLQRDSSFSLFIWEIQYIIQKAKIFISCGIIISAEGQGTSRMRCSITPLLIWERLEHIISYFSSDNKPTNSSYENAYSNEIEQFSNATIRSNIPHMSSEAEFILILSRMSNETSIHTMHDSHIRYWIPHTSSECKRIIIWDDKEPHMRVSRSPIWDNSAIRFM